MFDRPKDPAPGEYPPFMPEVTPELVPVPETEREKKVPIDVINGALEKIRRKEEDQKGGEGGMRKPTIH